MKILTIPCILAFALVISCNKDSASDMPEIPDQSFVEEFESAVLADARGWDYINKSVDLGSTAWGNPSEPPFEAFSYSTNPNGYLWADFNSTSSAAGIISNWALSPPITMQNGDKIVFHTRAQLYYFNNDSTDFVNRLQVRINTRNTGQEVGNGTSTGDFNTLLLDINPGYNEFLYIPWQNREASALSAYPHRWTRFEAVISGLPGPTEGRFAFRYFVEGGGNNGRATAVGIDQVSYISSTN
jgi:hypothetical protein